MFNSLVNSTADCSPLSDTILFGNPCNFYMLFLNNLANLSTEVLFVVATKYIILNNLLQTTRITFFTATNGNLVIKSRVSMVFLVLYLTSTSLLVLLSYFSSSDISHICYMQVYLSGNYIPTVISSPNRTSLSSTVAIFLATRLIVVLQPSRYSIFHSGDTPIRLGLPWQSYSC